MTIINEIRTIIIKKLQPKHLELLDNSKNHAGHAGVKNAQPEVTHLKIVISRSDVPGNSTLEKHKNINNLLSDYHKVIHSIELNLI